MLKFVLFQTANVHFAIELNAIRHMGPYKTVPSATQGRVQQQTINYHDRSLKLIDLAAALGQNTDTPYPLDGKVVIAKGAPANALWVDSVKGVFTATAACLQDLPAVFSATVRKCFPKVLRYKEQLFLVADAGELGKHHHNGDASRSTSSIIEQAG